MARVRSLRFAGIIEAPLSVDDLPDTEDLTSIEEWKQIGQIRFALEASQGTDTDSDEQRDHIMRYDLTTRYHPEIKAGMRINMDGRHLNILGLPIPDQEQHWLSIQVEELIA